MDTGNMHGHRLSTGGEITDLAEVVDRDSQGDGPTTTGDKITLPLAIDIGIFGIVVDFNVGFGLLVDFGFEQPQGFTEGTAQFGNFLRAKNEQGDAQNEDNLCPTEIKHGDTQL
jgi:hypothetical protein